MVFENGAYATIWKVFKVNDKGTSIKANISIRQKHGDGYRTCYQGTAFFVNDTHWNGEQREVIPTVENLLKFVSEARNRDVVFDDQDYPRSMAPKIKILHCGSTRSWDNNARRENRCDFIFDFEIPNNSNKSSEHAPAQKKMKQNGSFVDLPKSDLDEELPFV